MSGRRKAYIIFICLISVFYGTCILAQQNETKSVAPQKKEQLVKESKNVPQEVKKSQRIPVMVVYEDMDSLGRRLIFNLRERLNKSNLFRLSGYQEEKIKIVVESQNEFKGRPGLSSIYSIVWTFSYGENVLSNYLKSEVGLISSNSISDKAEALAARTDEIYRDYSYLFEDE